MNLRCARTDMMMPKPASSEPPRPPVTASPAPLKKPSPPPERRGLRIAVGVLMGAGFASLDLSVSKRMALGSSRALELRLEIFNALSRQNLNLPDSFVDRPTFGQSLSALPARQAQLAARLTF